MRRAVLNVVGLSARDLSSGVMPRLAARAAKGSVAKVRPAFPAVTCTAQSDYLTGKQPSVHGIVGNGWYDRTLSEVQFWKQSNRVVLASKVWDELHAKNPKLKVANLFWWYNMGTAADISVTPRPVYKADGGKIFDIASYPQRYKELLKRELGDFPFHSFWGPRAGLPSSQWIADSARWIEEHEQPDLSLVYLPHLDYDLQRFGPADPRCDVARRDVDKLVGDLAEFLELDGVPQRIEVYDNSHIQGSHAVGAMIVAGPDGFEKSQYRKWTIKDAKGGDDFAMMTEVLTRARPEWTEWQLAGAGAEALWRRGIEPTLTLEQAHAIVVEAENRILAAFPRADILIHPDPEGLVDEGAHIVVQHRVLGPPSDGFLHQLGLGLERGEQNPDRREKAIDDHHGRSREAQAGRSGLEGG